MSEQEKSITKNFYALTRFDPKARKELVIRGLNALAEIKDANYYFFKGEEHRIKGELKQAIIYYEKALQIDPEHEDSLFWMGYCYLLEQVENELELDNTLRNKKAAIAFQKLTDIQKKNDSIGWSSYVVYYNLGLAQYNLNLYEEAIKSFERSLELNPDDGASHFMLSLSQEKFGTYHFVLDSFKAYPRFEIMSLTVEQT